MTLSQGIFRFMLKKIVWITYDTSKEYLDSEKLNL